MYMQRMPQAGEKWRLNAPERAEGWACPNCGVSAGQNVHEHNGEIVTVRGIATARILCFWCSRMYPAPEGTMYVYNDDGGSAVPYTWFEPF